MAARFILRVCQTLLPPGENVKKPIIFAIAIGALGHISDNASAQQNGVIERTQGDVRIIRAGQTFTAQKGSEVRARDRIEVGANGATGFTSPDKGMYSLGPNSQMVVDEIRFNPQTQDGNIAVKFLKGTFSAVTGLLGKISPEKHRIQTPTATIGVRGTEYSVRVDVPARLEKDTAILEAGGQSGQALSDVSLTVGLDQGAIDVNSTTGPLGLYRERRQAETNDFESFKNQMREGVQKEKDAFEQYKTQIKREFVGYVKSVSMKAGTEITVAGSTAVEREGVGENPARGFMREWRGAR